jgi:hypothetical protein
VAAGRLQALLTEVTGAVGPDERGDDQVAAPEARHVGSHVLDHADELVPDPIALSSGGPGAIGPQVAAADTRLHDADKRVGRFAQRRVRHVLDAHVTRAVDQRRSHEHRPLVEVSDHQAVVSVIVAPSIRPGSPASDDRRDDHCGARSP